MTLKYQTKNPHRPPGTQFQQRMRLAHRYLDSEAPHELGITRPWGPALAIFAFAIIVYGTLFPFNFQAHAIDRFDLRLYDPSDMTDWIANVGLFMPFGFGIACLLAGCGRRPRWQLLAAIGGSALLSATVESLQRLLPTRDPSVADILANTTGGLFGGLIFHHVGVSVLAVAGRQARRVRRHMTARWIAALFVLWTTAVVLVPAWLLRPPRLAVWDASFPLALGNEATGERPWEGSISDLQFADRAATQSEAGRLLSDDGFSTVMGGNVIASYSLVGARSGNGSKFIDIAGHLPDLVWSSKQSETADGAAAHFSDGHFLATDQPATGLSKAIASSSQFTVRLVVASDGPNQSGPARLVTLSPHTLQRNFMLGQQGASLIIRLRTRGAGPNGECPQWSVPGIFSDSRPHQLLVTYVGSLLSLYVDSPAKKYVMHTPPVFTLVRALLVRDMVTLPAGGAGPIYLSVVYFTITLFPLAFLLGLFVANPSSSLRVRAVAAAGGILLPTSILQLTLHAMGATIAGNLDLLVASAILAIGTAVSAAWWSHGPARGAVLRPGVEVLFAGYSRQPK